MIGGLSKIILPSVYSCVSIYHGTQLQCDAIEVHVLTSMIIILKHYVNTKIIYRHFFRHMRGQCIFIWNTWVASFIYRISICCNMSLLFLWYISKSCTIIFLHDRLLWGTALHCFKYPIKHLRVSLYTLWVSYVTKPARVQVKDITISSISKIWLLDAR